MPRILCRLLACRYDNGRCRRCGAEVYDWGYLHLGLLSGVISLYLRFRVHWFPRRCDVCGRRYWPNGKPWAYSCSDECDAKHEDIIPF